MPDKDSQPKEPLIFTKHVLSYEGILNRRSTHNVHEHQCTHGYLMTCCQSTVGLTFA